MAKSGCEGFCLAALVVYKRFIFVYHADIQMDAGSEVSILA